MRAHDPVALGRHPDVGLAVLRHAGDAGVRLDVALVHRLGGERALDDDVGLLKPAATSPSTNSMRLATLEGRLGRRLDAGGDHVLVQERRARAASPRRRR